MYEARDLPPGQQMVEYFKTFLRHLLDLNLSGKTLRKHRDNLWLLGGEIIADLHQSPRLRKRCSPGPTWCPGWPALSPRRWSPERADRSRPRRQGVQVGALRPATAAAMPICSSRGWSSTN